MKILCPHKNVDTNVHSSTCHPKSRINKMWSLHTMSNHSLYAIIVCNHCMHSLYAVTHCDEVVPATVSMNSEHYAEWKPDMKGPTVNDPIDMKYPEKANLETESRLLVVRNWSKMENESKCRVYLLLRQQICSRIDSSNSCKILWTHWKNHGNKHFGWIVWCMNYISTKLFYMY